MEHRAFTGRRYYLTLRSLCSCCHLVKYRHELVSLARREKTLGPMWCQVSERRLIESCRLDYAVVGQIIHDQVSKFDLVRGQHLAIHKFRERLFCRLPV